MGGRDLVTVCSPARSEISGNHTDHEGGRVIAGALDRNIIGLAAANGTDEIRLTSEGFDPIEVPLDDLEPQEDEKVTTAGLVRGMAHELVSTGRVASGFDIAMTSNIPAGGGLSSSAALELALGRVMEALWDGAPVDAATLARMGQTAENDYFGKPCGLMDQLAVALGGLAHMDFADPAKPTFAKLALDFEDMGYALCLVDVGCDHSQFTDEYAAVPVEMQAVARAFGKTRLLDVDEDEFDAAVPALRRELGDRAVLRAIHFWREDELVDARWDALKAADIDSFLELTRESGASSAMFLQNVACGDAFQPAMVALGLAERTLKGHGAARIHGGGFGGSIQAFVPLDEVGRFTSAMDGWLGEGACQRYAIAEEGASASWL
ncbi:MAG: galactokinase [Atopobiaceae bacterium]|nr:galactokinase [Atopobiaceae bacterium]MCI2174195.1 galactokinase [Atopobiaceae bacterium]MCI2206836.1 galactokinase [Atopobiaceae bacterium]